SPSSSRTHSWYWRSAAERSPDRAYRRIRSRCAGSWSGSSASRALACASALAMSPLDSASAASVFSESPYSARSASVCVACHSSNCELSRSEKPSRDGAPSSVITSCGIARSIHTPSRGRNAFGTPLEQTPPHEAVRGVTRSRVVAWALATATFVLIVVGGVFQLLDGGATRSGFGPLWPNLLSDLTLLATGAIALVLPVRRASNPVGWVLSASALIGVISLAASGYATYGIRIHPGALAATEWGAWIGNWIGRVTSGFFLLAFLLFPTGRLVSR